MRYAQRGGYTPAEQQRRERLQPEAADRFARGDAISEIARDLRITPGPCSSGTGPGARQVFDLLSDRGGHGLGERDVLVNGVDPEHLCLTVGEGVKLVGQLVAVQDRQRQVAPPAADRGLLHLHLVVESEPFDGALAVVDEPVKARQQRRPAQPWAGPGLMPATVIPEECGSPPCSGGPRR